MSLGFSIRVGTITKVDKTRLYFALTERLDTQEFEVSIPHPYAGKGGGIFAGFERGALILVIKGPAERWYCVGTVPSRGFYSDLDGTTDSRLHETPYPDLKPGEISLKSNRGSRVDLLDDGNVRLDAGMGISLADIELSRSTEALFVRTPNRYTFTESGRTIEGIVRRDMNAVERSADTNTLNFLDGERYHRLLSDIGRSSVDEVQNRTAFQLKQTTRNPALVEKREIIYEYADSFDVRTIEDERDRLTDTDVLAQQTPNYVRQKRRTDILNLNQLNYNHLIEKVEGTLVDIYGNVLDLNRNIVNIPPIETQANDNKNSLKKTYDYHRRGIKYHYEINSRKDLNGVEPPESDKNTNNAKAFSRWSMDVDGEGQTKINIPASSETGNISVLSRYFTNRNDGENDGDDTDQNKKELLVHPKSTETQRRDISQHQFGLDGVKIDNTDYKPPGVGTAGTAYHEIMNVASSIFEKGKLGDSGSAMSSSVSNKIGDRGGPDSGAKAGGRSVHMNLDGSMEMSIGADSVDKKSWVIDTQGSVISHYGKDNNGRSIIHQSDGDVLVQIGGGKTSGDSRFTGESGGNGRLEIHLARGGGTPQKILIDDQGLTLDVQGNMIFKSSGDMALDAGSRLLLHGEMVFVYGKTDIDSRQVVGQEALMIRSGSPQFT